MVGKLISPLISPPIDAYIDAIWRNNVQSVSIYFVYVWERINLRQEFNRKRFEFYMYKKTDNLNAENTTDWKYPESSIKIYGYFII